MIIQSIQKHRRLLGWLLILLSFCIGMMLLQVGIFNDEADNLVAGRLILQGQQLYTNIFSHHFPFAYYWTAASIFIFGQSISLLRLSMLIFQTAAFITAMLVTDATISVGLVAVFWACIKFIFFGNMVLYSSFDGVSTAVVFIIVLNLLLSDEKTSIWRDVLAISLFSLIAMLSNPLTVYPIAIAYLALLIKHPPTAVYAAIIPAAGIVAYAIYLLSSGNFASFFDQAILFNVQIYAQYKFASPLLFENLFHPLISGLGILDLLVLTPLSPESTFSGLLNWFFIQSNTIALISVFFKAAVLSLTLYLALNKKILQAVFVYVFTAATLIFNNSSFNSQTFIVSALAATTLFFAMVATSPSRHKVLAIPALAVSSLATGVVGVIAVLAIVNVQANFPQYKSSSQLASYVAMDAHYREITCNLPNVKLAVYPAGGYHYWFAQLQPVSRYLYMWPWVAEYGQNEVIQELANPDERALVVIQDSTIWLKYDSKIYLKPLADYLDANYRKVEAQTYISPALAAACPLYDQ